MLTFQWIGPASIMVLISLVYFLMAKNENLKERLLLSMHGISAVILYALAMVVWESNPDYRPWTALPFLVLHLVPVSSIVFALIRFKGTKILHLAQVPNILCMFYTYCIGAMAITGDWL